MVTRPAVAIIGLKLRGSAPINQIAQTVGFPCLYEGEIGAERLFSRTYPLPSITFRFLPLSDDRSVPGRRENPPIPAPAARIPSRRTCLGHEFNLDFSVKELSLKSRFLAERRCDHFLTCPRFQQNARAKVVDPMFYCCSEREVSRSTRV